MKKLKVLLLVLIVLLCPSIFLAQWDKDAEKSILVVNEWQCGIELLQFLKPWDKNETYSFMNYKDSLQIFKIKGGTISLGGKWIVQGLFFKNTLLEEIPDFITLEAKCISSSNLSTNLVRLQVQSKEWAISPAIKETNPLDGTRILYTYDLRDSKEKLSGGIKRIYILPKGYANDSCEVDLTIGVRNLTCIYVVNGSKKIIDFDFTKTEIQEPQVVIPTEFVLYQNYPNPFNPSTTIRFSIPESGNYTLKVYDSLGQEVETLIDAYLAPGVQEYSFNGENLSSGTYIYRLQGNNFSLSQKMSLIK